MCLFFTKVIFYKKNRPAKGLTQIPAGMTIEIIQWIYQLKDNPTAKGYSSGPWFSLKREEI